MFQALYLISSLTLHTTTAISMQDTKPKTHSKTYNHLPTAHKPQLYYHPHLQQQQQHNHHQQQPQQQPQQQIIYQPQYVPVPVLAKAAYSPQPPQQIPAMIIIAAPQPTPTAYPAAIQQLLHYFHTNPQARQQLLYGASQQQATTPTYVVAAAPSPAQYYTPAPTQYYYTAQPPQQQEAQPQPLQLQQLAEMAQTTAQRLYGGQIKTAAPIITGLENFTPDQQAQIKARLNDVISQDQQQQQQQHGGGAMNDFVPSPEIKGEEGGVAYIGGSDVSGQGYSTKG